MNTIRKSEKESYEKLRDELFETRVDLKAWKRSIKILASSISILFLILGYFGYNKFESAQTQIMNKAYLRLAKTDSLLAQIDENKIHLINAKIQQSQRNIEFISDNLQLDTIYHKKDILLSSILRTQLELASAKHSINMLNRLIDSLRKTNPALILK